MRRSVGLLAAALFWGIWMSPALAEEVVMTGSRYTAPLWTWIAAIVVTVGLSIVGLAIGWWFLRKRSQLESSE